MPIDESSALDRREFLASALLATTAALRARYPAVFSGTRGAVLPSLASLPFWNAGIDAATLTRTTHEQLIAAKASIQSLVDVAGARTLDNTLRPYDEALRLSANALFPSSFLAQVHPDAAVRAAADQASQQIGAFYSDLFQRRDVYRAFMALDMRRAETTVRNAVVEIRKIFRFGGVDNDDATRAILERANDDATSASQEFSRNINRDRRTVITNLAELEGLPLDFVAAHPPDAEGRITLTTEYPDATPVLSYARSAALRKRMYLALNNRGYPQNMAVLRRMFTAHHAIAKAGGFSSYAESATYFNMVGTAQAASDFLDQVDRVCRARAAREFAQILEAKRIDEPGATTMDASELAYYTEQVRRTKYDFDSQSARPYFPFAGVKQGILDIMSRLFGIAFHPVPDAPRWHTSVEVFDVHEANRVLGRIYLDLHPRADKYQHTAQFGIIGGSGGRQLPEAALVCNFPGGAAGDPGLLEHTQVRSFFHEFGHLLHEIFSGASPWFLMNGISGIARDFSEVPSTLLENWMLDASVLRTFARHHETHEPIPTALVAGMRRAAEFNRGLSARRSLVYAQFSLQVERGNPDVDTDALYRAIYERYLPYTFAEGTHHQTSFVHLDSLSAVYYTYLWSEVIARDLSSGFDAHNLMDVSRARRYRTQVLEPGSARTPAELVTAFLRRPYRFDAWQRWLDADD